MPFSAAGALMVLLVLGMIGQAAWLRHQRSLSVVDDISDSALLTIAAGIQGDLRTAAKYAVYRALWEVGKRADDYDDAARERAIEELSTMYFTERVAELVPAYAQHDPRVGLEIPDSATWPALDLVRVDGGYALARAGLPEGTTIGLTSRDNGLMLTLPLDEKLEAFIDSRYFLLQERMGRFVEYRGNINTVWGIMEYASAWGGAWLAGKVDLSTSRCKAFFEAAWAIHEYDTFGSSDYWAAAERLIDSAGGGLLSELQGGSIVVTPINSADVDSMRGYIDLALGALEDATTYLGDVKHYVGLAKDAAALLSEGTENEGELLENIRGLLGSAIESVARARGEISEASRQFNQLLEFISNAGSNDVVMAALSQSLTSRMLDEDYPSLEEQVGWGVEGTLTKLLELEQAITDASAELDAGELEILLGGLFEQVVNSTADLLSEPTPERWISLASYDEENQPIEVPVYLHDETGGTIELLKLMLKGAKEDLDKMGQFSQELDEPTPDELQTLEIEKGLIQRIEAAPPKLSGGREQFYEILPPAPINPSPGLSVFHEFDVKSITHARRDPAGRSGCPTATPIPLWFIGVTLWWGEWESTLELEPGPIEEIFDFDNPTLPLAHGDYYVHKPLAYRWRMPEEPFRIEVVVISLRPFTISTS